MKKQFASVLALSLLSSGVMAEGAYMGADLGVMDVEFTAKGFDDSVKAEPMAIRALGGYALSDYLALEGYVGLGLGDDTFEDSNLKVELDSMFGASVVGLLPINDTIALFAKGGLVSIEYTDSDNDSYKDTGFAYAVGGKFKLSPIAALTVEYTALPDADIDSDAYAYDYYIESSMLSLGCQFSL